MNRGKEVEIDGALPSVGRLIFERGRGRAGRITEQDVQPTKLLRDILNQLLRLSRHADVCGERRRLGIAPVKGNLRPLGFQRGRNRASDAACATADERNAAPES